MSKFAIEYKKVEIHFFVVEADSIDDAKKIVKRSEPEEINLLQYELDTFEKIEDGADMLSPTEYFKLKKKGDIANG